MDMVDGSALLVFSKSQYKIESGAAERLAVEHVSHALNSDDTADSSRKFWCIACAGLIRFGGY